jgi:hypothetical protein
MAVWVQPQSTTSHRKKRKLRYANGFQVSGLRVAALLVYADSFRRGFVVFVGYLGFIVRAFRVIVGCGGRTRRQVAVGGYIQPLDLMQVMAPLQPSVSLPRN